MDDTARTCRVLLFCGIVHIFTSGFTTWAAANDPNRPGPDQRPAIVVADTTDRPLTWRHS